jgi:hypothetical protein
MLAKSIETDAHNSTDIAVKSAYSYVGQEILNSFPIPKIPKELK